MDSIERSLETDRHEGLLSRIAEGGTEFAAFSSDGCSGGLSSAWEAFSSRFPDFAELHGDLPPWQECCVSHDRAYHRGGADSASASDSFERRKQADLELARCVVETGPARSSVLQESYGLSDAQVKEIYALVSESMYRAVRLGGIPCTELPWRWGYGWPLCREPR